MSEIEQEGSKATPETVNNYGRALYSEAGRHAPLSTIEELDPAQVDTLSQRCKELRLPTLVLWRHHDKIVLVRLGSRLASESEDIARALMTVTWGYPSQRARWSTPE
jgi:hypothetical protein